MTERKKDNIFLVGFLVMAVFGILACVAIILVESGVGAKPCDYDPATHVHYVRGKWYNDDWSVTGLAPQEDSDIRCPVVTP